MMERAVATLLAALAPFAGLACNPQLGEPLTASDPTFEAAAETFASPSAGRYARIAAFETMLRVEGAAFGAVLRDGYLSDDPDIVATATFCEVMRANGAVARVTGLPDDADEMTDGQRAQILSFAFPMARAGADWSQGCLSTRDHPRSGCNPSYFISVRDAVVRFRNDGQTGSFRRVDGEFRGVIELVYGGPTYSVPARLDLQ